MLKYICLGCSRSECISNLYSNNLLSCNLYTVLISVSKHNLINRKLPMKFEIPWQNLIAKKLITS